MATYNYDAIPNNLTSYNYSLARLLYHNGVATQMGYGWDGSGTQSELALQALQNYFSYAQLAQFQHITDVVADTNNATLLRQWAMDMAIFASVTVSMAAETKGRLSIILRVNRVFKLTSLGKTSE